MKEMLLVEYNDDMYIETITGKILNIEDIREYEADEILLTSPEKIYIKLAEYFKFEGNINNCEFYYRTGNKLHVIGGKMELMVYLMTKYIETLAY